MNIDSTCFPVQLEIPVAWGEMDAFGHVNNTVYFRYFESARIEYFRRLGLKQSNDGTGPILASTRCDFLYPLTHPDTVVAETGITRVGRSSFIMAYRVRSLTLDRDVARGEGVIVYYHYGQGRSEPLPEDLRQAIAALEGEPSPES